MDRRTLSKQLYDVVRHPLQDGVNLALRNYGPGATTNGQPADPERWGKVEAAINQLNDAFEQVANEKIPLRGALRNLATRSVELRHIADALNPERGRHIVVSERLCCASTLLKETAAYQRDQLAAEGPAR